MRYRVQYPIQGSRRRLDIAFTRSRVAIDVRGCFWHACPEHSTWPQANSVWWREKLLANRRRDEDTAERLKANGWDLIVVWEHEEPVAAADRVEAALRRRLS
jgi:DNA mismatch endonuclease, patch repair protein